MVPGLPDLPLAPSCVSLPVAGPRSQFFFVGTPLIKAHFKVPTLRFRLFGNDSGAFRESGMKNGMKVLA